MGKHKIDINKNSLSWEKTFFRKCDSKDCNSEGKFKAPKSRVLLNQYYYFCMEHIKEYNKSWDFYKGLTVDQIEQSIQKDAVWDRPSWPLQGNTAKIMEQINDFINTDYFLFENHSEHNKFTKNKITNGELTQNQINALKSLELKLPINLEEIKKKYKKLVKIFHPDVNDNNKQAEIKFKEINESYKILLKKFVK